MAACGRDQDVINAVACAAGTHQRKTEREREKGKEWRVGAIKNFMDIAIKWEHKGVAEGLAGRG